MERNDETDEKAVASAKAASIKARSSARRFRRSFWNAVDAPEDDDDADLIKTLSGSSSLDADGGSSGPGDDAFCFSNWAWLIGALAVVHYSDFFRVVVFSAFSSSSPRPHRPAFFLGLSLLVINLSIFYYLVVHLSWRRGISSDRWDDVVPKAVPLAAASFCGAVLFLAAGLWPVWGIFTVPVLSTVFMGFVSGLAMTSRMAELARGWREKEKKVS